MSIIVTGASGQFGRMAAERLLELNPTEDLVLITRTPDKLADLAERGAEIRRGNFNDPRSLQSAFAGGEQMLLISTLDIGENRQRQHRNAIDAAVAAGVKRIVYTSSVGIHPKLPALSGRDHFETEEMLREAPVDFTILRNSQYAEVVATMIAPMGISMGQLIMSAGDGCMAFISKQDCVEAAVAVLTSPGHEGAVYEITGPELLNFADVAALAAELSGKPVQYVVVSDEERLAIFDAAGIPREFEEGMEGWASTEMVSYEHSLREHFFAILTHHFKMITGHHPRNLHEVFLENKAAWENA